MIEKGYRPCLGLQSLNLAEKNLQEADEITLTELEGEGSIRLT